MFPLKKTTTPTLFSVAKSVAKSRKDTVSSGERHGQRTIKFSETDTFYTDLDKLVKTKKKVIIKFPENKLSEDSQLWKRISKCKDWEEVADKIQTDSSTASKFVQPQLESSLATGTLVLIAFIASLVFSLAMYSIYKERTVKIKVKGGDNEGEIIIE